MDNQTIPDYRDSRSAHVSGEDVGQLFLDKDGSVWRMIAYVAEPQATFELIDDHKSRPSADSASRVGDVEEHVVGCLNHHEMGLRRLVVEEQRESGRPLNPLIQQIAQQTGAVCTCMSPVPCKYHGVNKL